MPRYSILLPTHNRDDIVGFAIESVLAQSEADFELLVVGDGCTDQTAAVIAGFRDPRLRWLDLPKAPTFGYANRNLALREARGELIAYLAHDDLWFPDHLQLLGDALDRVGAEWIYSLPLWVSPDGVIVPGCGNLNNPDELVAFLTLENFIPTACVVHRRSCLDRYGYWPEDGVLADWRYWMRMIEGGGRQNFGYVPTPTALHFKAIWRKTRDSGRIEVGAALAIADEASWWPESLKFAVPAGCSEQSVVRSALRRDDAGGPAAISAGAARVIGRLARNATEASLPRIAALEAAQIAESAERAALQAALLAESAERVTLQAALLVESAER